MTHPVTYPTVLLVTGPPGTGKTTLIARVLPRLAAAGLTLPVFTKDTFKETLFDTLGSGDPAWSHRLGRASMALLLQALAAEVAAGRSCLVEANFHAGLATPELAALREKVPFALFQILCRTEPAVLLARLRHRAEIRERHPGHLDPVWVPALDPETLPWRAEPLALESALLDVDTTDWDALDLDPIVARLVAFLSPKPGTADLAALNRHPVPADPAPEDPAPEDRGTRYVHTNLIAHDWRCLAAFYQEILGCTPSGPERDLSGPSIEAATGIPGVRIRGIHLRLPGHGEHGPTLEIFTYTSPGPRASCPLPGPRASCPLCGPRTSRPLPSLDRPGLGHLAFAVDDVAGTRAAVLAAGGGKIGDIVTLPVTGAGTVTFVYLTDPEGNVIEVQRWSGGGD